MKSQRAVYTLIIFLILSISGVWYFSGLERQAPVEIFPATIDRDCAPWDAPAFTISIPYEAGSSINISIWQEPDIKLPARFFFPDESIRGGSAIFLLRYSYPVELAGIVFLSRVERDNPVEGRFDLVTETGQRLDGKFKAEWGNEIVYCA